MNMFFRWWLTTNDVFSQNKNISQDLSTFISLSQDSDWAVGCCCMKYVINAVLYGGDHHMALQLQLSVIEAPINSLLSCSGITRTF